MKRRGFVTFPIYSTCSFPGEPVIACGALCPPYSTFIRLTHTLFGSTRLSSPKPPRMSVSGMETTPTSWTSTGTRGFSPSVSFYKSGETIESVRGTIGRCGGNSTSRFLSCNHTSSSRSGDEHAWLSTDMPITPNPVTTGSPRPFCGCLSPSSRRRIVPWTSWRGEKSLSKSIAQHLAVRRQTKRSNETK